MEEHMRPHFCRLTVCPVARFYPVHVLPQTWVFGEVQITVNYIEPARS